MKKTLYLECGSGISGDMTVAALLDLGADQDAMDRALVSLPHEFSWQVGTAVKNGLTCRDFRVLLPEDNHDHDMAYLHGDGTAACHDHNPDHDHSRENHDGHHGEDGHDDHDSDQHHHHHHHGPGHVHRTLSDILPLLYRADMTESARDLAVKIFRILAEAESKAHGVPAGQVHFHEVGAMDAVADITAAAVCFDSLDIGEVIVDRVYEGRGMVRCQHGLLPIPVPAVLNIAGDHGLPLSIGDVEGEFVTPTGAAFLAAVMTQDRLPAKFRVVRTGLGAGKRTYARPSILRAMLIEPMKEPLSGKVQEKVVKLEANVDDSTGEELGLALERLMEAGAREVNYTPVYMKKNRPGWLLTVIAGPADAGRLEDLIFRVTSTIGIRRTEMARSVLPRRLVTRDTPYGPVRVKQCDLGGGQVKEAPEFEDVKRAAAEAGVDFRAVYLAACVK